MGAVTVQAEQETTVIEKVRRALGRTAPLAAAPVPPKIDMPITRLVSSTANLAEVFAARAAEQKTQVAFVSSSEIAGRLISFLRENNCRRTALAASPLFERLRILPSLQQAGFDARSWEQITLDEMYDFDCGITDVTYAVAETGSVVIRPSARHGRGLSLVPMFHVAIVEQGQILPDLVDLFEQLTNEGAGSNVIIISGPSKTADIEMNVVTGVHGPNVVQVYVLH